LRHGFYSQAWDEALIALGEDPDEYAHLLKSLENNLAEGLESELVLRIARALWRMKRSERMQDGLALKRVQSGMQTENILAASKLERAYHTLERLEGLATALTCRDYVPSLAETQVFVEGFGSNPSPEMQKVFLLLRSVGEAAQKEPGPASESLGTEPGKQAAEERERGAERRNLQALTDQLIADHRNVCSQLLEQFKNVQSPENRAALMAPNDASAVLMQRMEDSSLRQLWRLPNVLMRIRNGVLT
jgi:hypothetical protein